MQVNSSMITTQSYQSPTNHEKIKDNLKAQEKQLVLDAVKQTQQLDFSPLFEKGASFAKEIGEAQAKLEKIIENDADMKEFFSGDVSKESFSLKDLGYEGKAISDLSADEALSLLGEDGFFGVSESSKRASDFVINGAGDDVGLLKAGRDGIVKGFEEAEKLWGGKLPDIAYETQEKTLQAIDEKINYLGGKVLDIAA
jgi:hypothetical protein